MLHFRLVRVLLRVRAFFVSRQVLALLQVRAGAGLFRQSYSEHIYGVSGGQERYVSNGWTAEVTSSQPALETGLRTALVTRPLTSQEPIYTYVALPTSAGPPVSEGIFRQPASAGLSASAGTFASAGTSAGAGLFRHSYSAGTTYGPAQHYQPVTVH